MKLLLGINRRCIGSDGTWLVQRPEDTWEIEIPDDGSEFLSSIWMMADGLEVMRLPFTMGPAMTAACNV